MKLLLSIILLLICSVWASATTRTVCASGCDFTSIQSAINASAGGDIVLLTAGQTYDISSPLTLPTHSAGVVTIKGTEDASIPQPTLIRQPMSAGVTAHMPIIRTTSSSGSGCIDAESGNGGYRFNGILFTDNTTVGGVVYIQVNSGSDYTFDRVVVRPSGYPVLQANNYNTQARWGFQINADNVTIQDSDILGMYGLPPGSAPGATGVDGNGIVQDSRGTNLLVQRNYVEAWFDHIFLGGSDPPASVTTTVSGSPTTHDATVLDASQINIGQVIAFLMPFDANECKNDSGHPCWGDAKITGKSGNNLTFSDGLVCNTNGGGARTPCTHTPLVPGSVLINGPQPTNATVKQNHFYTPVAFSTWQLANNNNHPKAVTEIKAANGLLFDGNYMDGFPNTFGTTSYNQAGGGPWTGNLNNTFSNNWQQNANVGIFSPLYDPYYLNTNGTNLVISNNLISGCDDNAATSGVTPQLTQGKGGTAVTFTHNSFYCSSYFGKLIGLEKNTQFYANPAYTFRDNTTAWGNYGITCEGGGFIDCMASLTESHNLFYYVATANPPSTTVSDQFPNSNSAPGPQTSITGVKVVNLTTCRAGTIGGCALASDSPGHNAASDGTDIGVNITTLATAIGGSGPASSGFRAAGKAQIKGKVVRH